MRQIEIKYPANNQDNGLNADDAAFSLAPNQVVNMENCRWGSTDKGVINTIESIGSTILLDSPQPSVSFAYHGGCEDVENERIIYCLRDIHSTHHKIMCYDYRNDIIYTVLLATQVTGGLNFDREYFIHSCRVINGLFYWTDNNNEPRRINIDAGIKLNQPSYDTDVEAYDTPIDSTVITIIRKPPNYPLAVLKTTSGSVGITLNTNQIKNNAFWFSYYYVYRDNEESTNSMWSTLAPYNYPTETNDIIRLRVSFSEHIQQDVQKIVVAVIYADGNEAFEVKIWDKANATDLAEINAHNAGSTQLTYYFANDQVGNALASTKLTKPFDSVPLKSEGLERANQRLFLANNLIGYTTPLSSSLTATAVTSSISPTAVKTGSGRRLAVVFFDKYMRQCGVAQSKLITVADKGFTLGTPYVYAIQWGLDNTEALTEIPDWAYFYTVASTKDLTRSSFVQAYAGSIFYASKSAEGVYSFDKTMYSTDNVGVAIKLNVLSGQGMGYVFNENDLMNLRVSNSGVVTSVTLAVKAQSGDYLILENYNLGTVDFNSIATFEIYTPNIKSASNFYYERGNIYSVSSPTLPDRQYSTLSGLINGDVYLLQRDSLNKITYSLPTGFIISETLFTLGCTFVSQLAASTKYLTGSSPLQSTSGFNPLTDNTRWIIKTLAVSSVTFNFRGIIKFWSTIDSDFTSMLEYNDGVTTTSFTIIPLQATNAGTLYVKEFNVDITMPINCRMYIYGHTTVGSILNGYHFDVTSMVVTTMADGTQTTFECMSPNDKYWQNWFTDAGRLQLVDRIGQQLIEGSIRWSNTIIDGTRTNGLSSFDGGDQKLLPAECGSINKIQITSKVQNELGIVMLAICEKQTASLYLAEVQQYGSNQQTTLTISDSVIGTVNVLKGNYGTVNPESVIEYRGNVYWLDAINGRYIQYSTNGLFPISNWKMTRFWRLWCEQYLSMTNAQIEALGNSPLVFTAVDPVHNELVISIPKLSSTPPKGYLPDYPSTIYPFDILDFQDKTIAYKIQSNQSESGNNKWMGAFGFCSEGFLAAENKLFSWKNGLLYIHNQTDSYNEIYGTQYKSRVMFVSNQEPLVPKVYDTIEIQGNMVPTFTYFFNGYPYEQATDLVDFDYRIYEGLFYAALYRNKLVPTASGYTTNGLLTAEKMRGRTMFCMLEFTVSSEPLELEFIQLKYSLSRGHNQIKQNG